jgi:hypothetical protein
MMRFVRPFAAIACLSLASSPVLAQSAAPLSLARAGAPMEGASDLTGSFIIPAVVLAAIIVGAIIVISDDDNDAPASP